MACDDHCWSMLTVHAVCQHCQWSKKMTHSTVTHRPAAEFPALVHCSCSHTTSPAVSEMLSHTVTCAALLFGSCQHCLPLLDVTQSHSSVHNFTLAKIIYSAHCLMSTNLFRSSTYWLNFCLLLLTIIPCHWICKPALFGACSKPG